MSESSAASTVLGVWSPDIKIESLSNSSWDSANERDFCMRRATLTELTMIVRRDCHLCADMRVVLDEWAEELRFTVKELDVDADPALLAAYDTLVPVLLRGEEEICHYFLDLVALRAALAA